MKSALFILVVSLEVTLAAVSARAHYHPHRKHYRPYHVEYVTTEIEHVYDVQEPPPGEGDGGGVTQEEPPKRTLRRTREVHKSRSVDPAEIWSDGEQDRPTVQHKHKEHSSVQGEAYIVDEAPAPVAAVGPRQDETNGARREVASHHDDERREVAARRDDERREASARRDDERREVVARRDDERREASARREAMARRDAAARLEKVADDRRDLAANDLPTHASPRSPERQPLFDTNVSSPQSRWAQPAVGLEDGPAQAEEPTPHERAVRQRRGEYEEDDRAYLGNEHGESRTSRRGAFRSSGRSRSKRTQRSRTFGDRADDDEPARRDERSDAGDDYWWGSSRRAAPRDAARGADDPEDERMDDRRVDPAVEGFLELRHKRGRRPDESYAVQLAPEPEVPRAEATPSPYVSLFSAQRGALTAPRADVAQEIEAAQATTRERIDDELIAGASPYEPATKGGRKLLSAARERVAAQQELEPSGVAPVAGPQLAGTSPFAEDKVAGDNMFSGQQKVVSAGTAGPKLAGVASADALPEVASTLDDSPKDESPTPLLRDTLVAQLPAVPKWTVKRWNPADGAVDANPSSMTQGARDRSMPLDLATDATPKRKARKNKVEKTQVAAAKPEPAPAPPPALTPPAQPPAVPDALAHLTQQAEQADHARQLPVEPAPDAAAAQSAAEVRQAQIAQQVSEQVAALKAEEARREQLALQVRQAEQARQAQLALQAQAAEKARQAQLALEAQKAEEARQAQLAQAARDEAARKAELAAQAERARQSQIALEAQRAELARQAAVAAQRAEAARQAELALKAQQDRLAAAPPPADLRASEPGLGSEPGAAEMYAQREAIATALASRRKGARRSGTAWNTKQPRAQFRAAAPVAAPAVTGAPAPFAPELRAVTPPAASMATGAQALAPELRAVAPASAPETTGAADRGGKTVSGGAADASTNPYASVRVHGVEPESTSADAPFYPATATGTAVPSDSTSAAMRAGNAAGAAVRAVTSADEPNRTANQGVPRAGDAAPRPAAPRPANRATTPAAPVRTGTSAAAPARTPPVRVATAPALVPGRRGVPPRASMDDDAVAAPAIRVASVPVKAAPPAVVPAKLAPVAKAVASPIAMEQRVTIQGQKIVIETRPDITATTVTPRLAGKSEMPLTLAGVPDVQIDKPAKTRPHVAVDPKTATAAPALSTRLATSLRTFLHGTRTVGAPVPVIRPVAPVPPAPPAPAMRVAQKSAPRTVAPPEASLPSRKVAVAEASLPSNRVAVAQDAILPPLERIAKETSIQNSSPYRKISALRDQWIPSEAPIIDRTYEPVKRKTTRSAGL